MLMPSGTIKLTSEPIGGVEYRRWLAEQGDSFTNAVEPASDDEIAIFRRVGQATPAPPERDSDFWPWARKFLERADHPRFLSVADLLCAWCEAFDEIYASGYGWQSFVENAAAKGLAGAADELDAIDAEDLGNDEQEERLSAMMLWARMRHLRKIRKLTGTMPTDIDDLTNEEIFDWLDVLNYHVSRWRLARSAKYSQNAPL